MAIFTDAPWMTRNDPLQFMERGAQLGLEKRGQDISQIDAGQRLRLSYDSLANQQENQRRAAALDAQQIAATTALKASQQDAMTNYRNQQIQEQQKIYQYAGKLDRFGLKDHVGQTWVLTITSLWTV